MQKIDAALRETYLDRMLAQVAELLGYSNDEATVERVARLISLSLIAAEGSQEKFNQDVLQGTDYGSLDVLMARVRLINLENDPDLRELVEIYEARLAKIIAPSDSGPEIVAFLRALSSTIAKVAGREPALVELKIKQGEVNLLATHWGVFLLAKTFCQMIQDEDPPNYLVTDFGIPGGGVEELGQVIVMRKNGETPAAKASRLEKEVAALKAEVAALKAAQAGEQSGEQA